jgi:hypothetical protein
VIVETDPFAPTNRRRWPLDSRAQGSGQIVEYLDCRETARASALDVHQM